ncbi:hypothetical protein [Actinoplanes sp. CA-252034]|uniref:hypothetical protein n=1 Tax=Actinoplanes sp. CA-252034 TaxID=3239906 RepID=UPI003D98DF68
MAIGALAGCANSAPETRATAAPTPAGAKGSAFLEPGLRFPEEAVKAYRGALAKIDEKIAADDDALKYGWNICLDIEQGKADAQVVKNAAARFEVDDATAKAIVKATKNSLCKQ